MRLLLLALLSGCVLVPQSALDDRLDPDGDGVPWPDDCNDDDGDLSERAIVYADADEDGFGDAASGSLECGIPSGFVADSTDCDDDDANAHPGGVEVCDGADNDCDDTTDDVAAPPTWTLDLDGDGYGRDGTEVIACNAPGAPWAQAGGDCDDDDATLNPGQPEECNGFDDDCDDLVDDDDVLTGAPEWFVDADTDGHGDPATALVACLAPEDRIGVGGDCNDADPAVHPGADEADCQDPVDYNCDGFTGGDDGDGDGFSACSECDDGDISVFPGATEVCDGVDQDCDDVVDDGASDALAWYPDDDGDKYGAIGAPVLACLTPDHHVAVAGDCADTDPAVRPGALETCNAIDDDCDDDVDDADDDVVGASTWYADGDGDQWGGAAVTACDQPANTRVVGGDCNDTVAAVHPGAPEANCDDPVDYNCDGSVGHVDTDGDTFEACADCDDGDAARKPGAPETCDDEDDDCDGTPDDAAIDAPTWFHDDDGDGFGDATAPAVACDVPVEHVADDTDCDDTNGLVNPGAGNCGQVDVDVGDGVALTGPTGARFGAAVAGVGDLDDDGDRDVLVGAPDAGGDGQGLSWAFSGPFTADRVAPAGAFLAIEGENQVDRAGGAATGIADLGADGIPEVVIGAPGAGQGSSQRGGVYIVSGGASGTLSLGAASVVERGAEASGDAAGSTVAVLADVNANGLPEVLVGAPGWGDPGAAYVLRPPLSGNATLATAYSARFAGEAAGDAAGTAVADAGDLDGNGGSWLAVGAPGRDVVANNAGVVYVVPGGTSGAVSLGTATQLLRGTVAGEGVGTALASLPDTNGDGADELIVGAPNAGGGAVYVVRGPVSGVVSLAVSHAILEGVGAGDAAGTRVLAADVTGDGLYDVVIGAPGADGGLGAVYVWPSPVAAGTATLAGAPYRVTGGGGSLGSSLANAGDLDGDGRDDLIVGDPDANTAWIVFGAQFTR